MVGVLLLSALLYYRSVKIQRFLEPALALSVPRSEFSRLITDALVHEFGQEPPGVRFRTSSITIDERLVFDHRDRISANGRAVLGKVARSFDSVLRDERTRADIASVLVILRYPERDASRASVVREAAQRKAWRVLEAMYDEEPELHTVFGYNFVAAVVPGSGLQGQHEPLEVRIIPSERMHIEFLQKLEKYAR
jgi:hypothetical protein